MPTPKRENGDCFLAMDLGGTSLRLASLSVSGSTLVNVPTPDPPDGANCIGQHLRNLANGHSVLGIGVSRAPGVNSSGVVDCWPSRPDWEGCALHAWIEHAGGRRPLSADDGVCAARWEAHDLLRHGSLTRAEVGRPLPNIACLSIGTGLGIGIMRPYESFVGGNGAETLAHQQFGTLPFLCKCGRRGCLQTALSAQGLKQVLAMGMVAELERALHAFFELLRDQYGVSVVVFTGGGVLRFGRLLLRQLFTGCAEANGLQVKIAIAPVGSALAGAFLMAMECFDPSGLDVVWWHRLDEFVAELAQFPEDERGSDWEKSVPFLRGTTPHKAKERP